MACIRNFMPNSDLLFFCQAAIFQFYHINMHILCVGHINHDLIMHKKMPLITIFSSFHGLKLFSDHHFNMDIFVLVRAMVEKLNLLHFIFFCFHEQLKLSLVSQNDLYGLAGYQIWGPTNDFCPQMRHDLTHQEGSGISCARAEV